jgi:hypothetical protein
MRITEFEHLHTMLVNGGATVTLAKCIFGYNDAAISNDTRQYFEFEEETIAQPLDTIIRIQHCQFLHSYSYPVVLVTDMTSGADLGSEALVISDPLDSGVVVLHTFMVDDEVIEPNLSLSYIAVDAATVPAARRGIDNTSAWFQEVQKVRSHSSFPLDVLSRVTVTHPLRHSWFFATFCVAWYHCSSEMTSSVSFPFANGRNMYRLFSLRSLPKE